MSENKDITPDPEETVIEDDEVLAHSADEEEDGAGCGVQFNRN